jgi:hypothetical protein
MASSAFGRVASALLLATAATTLPAMAQAMGVPDAPPVERIVARHEAFTFPTGFRTSDGRDVPQGTYDLLLIESEDRYFIHLIDRTTRKGIRLAAEGSGDLLVEAGAPTSVLIRSDSGKDRFLFVVGAFTATVPLSGRPG